MIVGGGGHTAGWAASWESGVLRWMMRGGGGVIREGAEQPRKMKKRKMEAHADDQKSKINIEDDYGAGDERMKERLRPPLERFLCHEYKI